MRLEGVEWVSETADTNAWTCQIRYKGHRLPDLVALRKYLEETMRAGARLYGVEATLQGHLVTQEGVLGLELSDTKEVLHLAPLQHKIQWDMKQKREAPTSEREKSAFSLLEVFATKKPKGLVRIVGVLEQKLEDKRFILEVREFQDSTIVMPAKRGLRLPSKQKQRGNR